MAPAGCSTSRSLTSTRRARRGAGEPRRGAPQRRRAPCRRCRRRGVATAARAAPRSRLGSASTVARSSTRISARRSPRGRGADGPQRGVLAPSRSRPGAPMLNDVSTATIVDRRRRRPRRGCRAARRPRPAAPARRRAAPAAADRAAGAAAAPRPAPGAGSGSAANACAGAVSCLRRCSTIGTRHGERAEQEPRREEGQPHHRPTVARAPADSRAATRRAASPSTPPGSPCRRRCRARGVGVLVASRARRDSARAPPPAPPAPRRRDSRSLNSSGPLEGERQLGLVEDVEDHHLHAARAEQHQPVDDVVGIVEQIGDRARSGRGARSASASSRSGLATSLPALGLTRSSASRIWCRCPARTRGRQAQADVLVEGGEPDRVALARHQPGDRRGQRRAVVPAWSSRRCRSPSTRWCRAAGGTSRLVSASHFLT